MTRPSRPAKRTRVRSKRLDQLDETKLALALWLLAKDMLAEEASESQPEAADASALSDVDEAA